MTQTSPYPKPAALVLLALLAAAAITACGGGDSTTATTVAVAPGTTPTGTVVTGSTTGSTTGTTSPATTTTGAVTNTPTGTTSTVAIGTATTAAGTTTPGTSTTGSGTAAAGTTSTAAVTPGATTTGPTSTPGATGTTSTTVITGTTGTAGTAGSTSGVVCNYSDSTFNASASVNATSTSAWTCTTTRVLVANGLPDHAVGIFPNSNNPNTIAAQNVTASYTLTPVQTATATELGGPRGVTAYVLNGVKVDAGTAGSCDNTGTSCSLAGNTGAWSIEALGQTSFNFGTDSNNAHVQPGGAYHYHGMPEGFITKRGGGPTKMTLIGWAADGFPVYARYGYSVATDAKSALKVMTASYQKVTTASSTRPSMTTYALGTFKQDWEYKAGTGDLDECNGRTGVTPEFPNGTYHYFATDTYPYLQRCVKGAVVIVGGAVQPAK